jgi:hypothetical protein
MQEGIQHGEKAFEYQAESQIPDGHGFPGR